MARSTREGALIAREGYPFIGIGAVFALLSLYAGWGTLGVLLLAVTAWVV